MRRTYTETLEFLYAQLPMFQRVGKAAFKKDLTNIRALLDVLDQNRRSYALASPTGRAAKRMQETLPMPAREAITQRLLERLGRQTGGLLAID